MKFRMVPGSARTASSLPPRVLAAAAALAAAVVLALTGCGASGSSSSSSTVSVRLPFPAGTLDPQQWTDGSAQVLASYAYDSPIALRDGKFVPELASKWKVTPSSAELTIRKDVTCSDGSKLSAKEVADSINRMKDPQEPSPNAEAVFGSPDGFAAKANAAANTVDLSLKAPYGDLEYGLTQINVVCRAGLENPALLKKETIGSGPYVLASKVSGDSYTYEVRDGYDWGPEPEVEGEQPSKLVFKVLESETTATNDFLTGGLDLTLAEGPDKARLENSDVATETQPVVSGAYTAYLNHAAGHPTADVDVRRLLYAGLDRQAMAVATLGAGAEAPRTILNPNAQCYDPEAIASAIIQPDAAAAQRYAEAAGYRLNGGKLEKDGEQLTLKVLVPDLFGSNVADFLISEWGKVGIKVDAQVLPTDQVVKTVSTPGSDWDVVTTGIDGDTPTKLLGAFGGPPPPDGPNISDTQNQDFLRLAGKAQEELTGEACQLWNEAERALFEQADFIPWVTFKANWYGHDVTFEPWTLQGVYPESLRTS